MTFTFDEAKHEYRLGGTVLPSVTQVLHAMGLIDDRYFTEFARQRGTAVHKMTELDDLETLDEERLDRRLLPYLVGWRKFRKEMGFIPTQIEYRNHSKYGFAGTLDRIGIDRKGRRILLDIKSSVNKPACIGLQLSAYLRMWNEKNGAPIHEVASVHLASDGTFKYEIWPDRQNDFLAVFRAYQIKQEVLSA